MAVMVPDMIDEFARRRFEAKRRVWTELKDQLSGDCTVFTMTGTDDESPVDFVILTRTGLVFMNVAGGVVDVLSSPQPGTEWTHRSSDGYFIGAIRPERLSEGARSITIRLSAALPAEHRRPPEDFGRAELHVLPDTLAIHAPGIDLASPQRQVLVASDLGRIAEWVDRASTARPACPPLSAELHRLLGHSLTQMAAHQAPAPAALFLRVRRRHLGLGLGAAALAGLALISGEFKGGYTASSTPGLVIEEKLASFTLPGFIPAKAEWAVRGAIEVAGENPGRPVKWRHDELSGTVTLITDQLQKCRTYRISLGQAETATSAERRLCR